MELIKIMKKIGIENKDNKIIGIKIVKKTCPGVYPNRDNEAEGVREALHLAKGTPQVL